MSTKREKTLYSFEEIYVSYFSRMKSFAQEYVLSEEDAENIVQDVFTELWEKKKDLTNEINLVAVIFTSIRNRCIDFLRHKIVVQETIYKMQEEFQLTLNVKLASLELFDQSLLEEDNIENIVTEAINSLPDKCREIFIRNKLEGKKQKEIAAELNISIKTVETQMSIAHRKLKLILKDYLPLLLFLLHS